jgi:transposase
MLMLPSSCKIFVSAAPCDMRRSFDRLASMVQEILHQSPLSGHLFVFRSRRNDHVKILYWERGGFAIWYRRLEKGTFRLPEKNAASFEMEPAELTLLLEGIDLAGATRRKRFEPKENAMTSGTL